MRFSSPALLINFVAAKIPSRCLGICFNDSECGSHGTCDSTFPVLLCASHLEIDQTQACVCSPSWDYKGDTCACDYHRRSRKKAFLLSFFLGSFGADRFYLYYGGIGAVKLIVGLIPCVLCIPLCIFSKTPVGLGLRIINALVSLAIFGWWLADVIRVGTKILRHVMGGLTHLSQGTGSLKDARGHKTWDNL